ncbi:MAG TPA: AAA family ATPase [Candidatus Paceibacterota bacterium]|nr:AAA family ATPase [Candidatus Paceibacterota bacterium]
MKLILINGPAGIGKSAVSARLHAELPQSILIDVDELRRSIPEYRERRKESLLLSYEKAREAAAEHLQKGETVIVDKGISFSETLDSFIEIGRRLGAEVCEILLFAAKETLQKRADARGYKPGSLLTRERVGELWDQFDRLRQERPTAVFIDTTNLTAEETYEHVKRAIE